MLLWTEMWKAYAEQRWGDFSGILGLYLGVAGIVLAVVGFGVTFYQVKKTRSAAQAAKRAVEQVKSDMASFKAATDIVVSLAMVEELKAWQRESKWELALPRYRQLRTYFIGVKMTIGLPEKQQTSLQGAIQQLKSLEEEIEAFLAGGPPVNIPNSNRILSLQADKLAAFVKQIENSIGGNHG